MDVFGSHWKDHYKKIKADWVKKVSDEDIVIVAGDISWAISEEGASKDLEWIEALPGRKIFVKGNHDFWWQSLKKLNEKYKTIDFIQNNAFLYGDVAFCGTRGWMIPNSEGFEESDTKIYRREVMRLERSIEAAREFKEAREIVVITHYPPITKQFLKTDFNDIILKNNIKHVIYGHLHDEKSWECTINGKYSGVNYYLTSCDYLNFKLLEIEI